MFKNYWLKTLFFFGAFLLLGKINAQVKFKVALQSDSITYQVSLYSEIGPFQATAQNFIPSSTITLIAPTGQLTPSSLISQRGTWTNNAADNYTDPVGIGRDYFVFILSGQINDIIFSPGLEVPLFTFQNTVSCAGAVELMDNDNDPIVNSGSSFNVGNQITVFGNGQENAYGGPFQPGSANCMGFPPCDLGLDTVMVSATSACGAADGSITITKMGGFGTVLYSINNGNDWFPTATFSNLASGSYSVKIKDDICEIIYINNPVVVSEPGITVTVSNNQAPSCNSTLDGTIAVAATGGTAPYQYSINNGGNWTTNPTFSNLGNGIFNIQARNADSTCASSFANNPIVFSTQGIDIQITKTCLLYTSPSPRD